MTVRLILRVVTQKKGRYFVLMATTLAGRAANAKAGLLWSLLMAMLCMSRGLTAGLVRTQRFCHNIELGPPLK